jgi:hypothetical protein
MPLLLRSFPDRPAFRVFDVPLPAVSLDMPAASQELTMTAPRGRRSTDAIAS